MLECANNIFFLICNADNIFKGFHGSCSYDGLPFEEGVGVGVGGLYVSYFSIYLNHIQSP